MPAPTDNFMNDFIATVVSTPSVTVAASTVTAITIVSIIIVLAHVENKRNRRERNDKALADTQRHNRRPSWGWWEHMR